MTAGRPGETVRLLSAGGLDLRRAVLRLAAAGPRGDPAAALALAEDLARKDGEARRAFAFGFLRDHAMAQARQAAAETADAAEPWLSLCAALDGLERDLTAARLDPKAVLMEAFPTVRHS